MTIEQEFQMEQKLMEELRSLDYSPALISNEEDLLKNLKTQLEIHNSKILKNKSLSENEFNKILNHLNESSIFECAKILRDKFYLEFDDGDGEWIEFFNLDNWCQNEFQFASQITMKGEYENRYDVTLLINGLPLVQIELKRRGLEIKEAFNQVNRYHKHSYGTGKGLFRYIQFL